MFKPFTFLITSLFLAATAQAGMYKWVDADGNVHYSQKAPPKGVEGKEIKVGPKSSFGESPAEAVDEALKKKEAEKKKEEEDLSQLTPEALKKRNCERVTKDYETLLNNPSVAMPDGDKLRRLSDEERKEALEKRRKLKEQYCQ